MDHSKGIKDAYKILAAKSEGKGALRISRHSREDLAFQCRMVMDQALLVKKKFCTQKKCTMKFIKIMFNY
jgi:hypothetical protein